MNNSNLQQQHQSTTGAPAGSSMNNNIHGGGSSSGTMNGGGMMGSLGNSLLINSGSLLGSSAGNNQHHQHLLNNSAAAAANYLHAAHHHGLGHYASSGIGSMGGNPTTTNNLLSSHHHPSSSLIGSQNHHPTLQLMSNGYPSNLSNLSSLSSQNPNSLLSHPSLSNLHHMQSGGLLDQQTLSFNPVRGSTTNGAGLVGGSSTGSLPSSSSLNNLAKLNTLKNMSHHELPINEFNSSSLNEQDAPPVPPNNNSLKPEPNPSSNNSSDKNKPSNSNSMANMQKEMSNLMKRPRRVAKLACVSCRKAHACCEDKRPCSRCLAHGLECQDQVGKKRGRKKKAGEDGDDEDDELPAELPANTTSASSSSIATATATAPTTATATTSSSSEKKKKKKKPSSPKKKKDKHAKAESSSLSEKESTQVPPAQPNQRTQSQQQQQSQMMNPNLVNTHTNLQHLESELKTPGALVTSGNVIFPNRDNHPLSLPYLLNQPPEIQQLTQILMRTPVDTFYLHCNNLNTAYDYQNNQSLFGTPYSLHVDEALLNQHQNHMNNLNNLKAQMNHHHHQQLVSPGANSPLIDFTNDEFLRFSPQSPLFASIVEMDENEIHSEMGHMMPMASNEDQHDRNSKYNTSNVNSSNNVNNDDVQIEDCEDNNQKPASSSKQEEEIFEKLKKMSNEEMIKSLQIGDDTKQMIEESIGHLKQFDSNPETANMTYIEYLTQNFPISLLLKHKLNDSAKRLASSNTGSGDDIQDEIESLREENKRLKEENLRKANESAMLSAINENLRNRFSELASKGIIKMQYDEPPTYGENNKPTAIQDSYQELVMLMENKQEMDSSDFGIILMFPGGRIISLNKTLLTKLNYDPSDLYDNLERWEDVVHPESYPQIIAHVSRVLKTPPAPRKSFKCKVNCRKRGGGMVPAELYLCIVGGKFSYIPVFAIGYFLFEEQKPSNDYEQGDN